ncbi:Uncharacterised protein [Legionella busanensis]|uniref:C-type lysozyme inhibitor domain-containing protein n=1 Tax=Legionella busanensis TaxID=190655 RepID=A0A378JN01_9GAMM|nr:hypothetical protein [Legionella busanensis]STX52635.1 Uncharacterised protein [Legionella busanensis]
MKKIWLMLVFLIQMATPFASQQTVICTMQGLKDKLLFPLPQKTAKLPQIDFPYPIETTIFVMREKNLLLVAMDQDEKSRLRLFISAQAANNKKNSEYKGQFMVDWGGNQLQLDNGLISCRLE